MRKLLTLLLAVLVMGAIAGPASATPPGEDGSHTVTICHVTNSVSNPWVIIEVDTAAFDGAGANDHTRHVSQDGRRDVLLPSNGVCPASTSIGT
ncbi:MAG: hypothetical protein GWP04_06465 [Gammaproteobacteria bacterium]|nr:hypothetical protein [Gammaproteobacteria bacterium]